MGKAGTLWSEKLKNIVIKQNNRKKGKQKGQVKNRLIAYHCLRMKISLKRRT